MQQKAIRALIRQRNYRHSGAPLQYSSGGRIGHWLVVSGDIASCRADQDSWFTAARGEPATLVEKPQVGPARGTGVQRRPLVTPITNNQRRGYADRLHNIRQLN